MARARPRRRGGVRHRAGRRAGQEDRRVLGPVRRADPRRVARVGPTPCAWSPADRAAAARHRGRRAGRGGDAQQGQRRPAGHLGRHRVRRTPGDEAWAPATAALVPGGSTSPDLAATADGWAQHQRGAPDRADRGASSSQPGDLSDDAHLAAPLPTAGDHPRPAARACCTAAAAPPEAQLSTGVTAVISPARTGLHLAGDVAERRRAAGRPRRGRQQDGRPISTPWVMS